MTKFCGRFQRIVMKLENRQISLRPVCFILNEEPRRMRMAVKPSL